MDIEIALKKLNFKINNLQAGIPTIMDNYFLGNIKRLLKEENYDKEFIVLFKEFIDDSCRYEDFKVRMNTHKQSILNNKQKLFSQGFKYTPMWGGNPLIKNPFDKFLIEMLISELQPRTIVEIGSSQGSYTWLRSLSGALNLNYKIFSIDLYHKIEVKPNDIFLNMDVNNIIDGLDREIFKSLSHPVLIIEDCHVNLTGIVNYFYNIMNEKDYLIIEDSIMKSDELLEIIPQKNELKVDTKYTDFFGFNGTSAVNSIFRKVNLNDNSSL